MSHCALGLKMNDISFANCTVKLAAALIRMPTLKTMLISFGRTRRCTQLYFLGLLASLSLPARFDVVRINV